MNKKAQEEMIGFALIVVIIGVIILIVFSLMIGNRKTNEEESLLLKSFVLSSLEADTLCSYNNENLSLREMIDECNNYNDICSNNGKNLCLMLNETVSEMVEKGFQVSNLSYYKAYEVSLKMDDKLTKISKGNATKNYYKATEEFSIGNSDYVFSLKLFA